MRSRAVNDLDKGRPVLFAIAKSKSMGEDDEFVVESLFMEDLYSRMSLSQLGETGVKGQAQTQVLIQAAQALIKSPSMSDDFYKGPCNSCVGRVCGLMIKSKIMRESRRTRLKMF